MVHHAEHYLSNISERFVETVDNSGSFLMMMAEWIGEITRKVRKLSYYKITSFFVRTHTDLYTGLFVRHLNVIFMCTIYKVLVFEKERKRTILSFVFRDRSRTVLVSNRKE